MRLGGDSGDQVALWPFGVHRSHCKYKSHFVGDREGICACSTPEAAKFYSRAALQDEVHGTLTKKLPLKRVPKRSIFNMRALCKQPPLQQRRAVGTVSVITPTEVRTHDSNSCGKYSRALDESYSGSVSFGLTRFFWRHLISPLLSTRRFAHTITL